MNADAEGRQERHLRLADAVAIYVGIILGSGIFVAPAAIATATDSALGGLAFWLVGGAIALCGGLCYAECGARLPRAGGFFVFYDVALGESFAFVGGWTALLLTYSSSLAAIALVCADYLSQLVPMLQDTDHGKPAAAAGAVLLATAINVVGLHAGPWTQRVLSGTKILALLALVVAALLGSRPTEAIVAPVVGASDSGLTFPALLAALVVVFWTYDGWSDVTLVGGELQDPGRNLGRTVVIGTAAIVSVYVLVQVAVSTLLGPAQAAASTHVVSDAVQVGLGTGASRLVALLVVVSTFGAVNAIVLTGGRIAFAMARAGMFLRWFGRLHPGWGTPVNGIAVLSGMAVFWVFASDFRQLLSYFTFAVWFFYALTVVALLRLRSRSVGEPLDWRAPGGLVPPLVVLGTAAFMMQGLARQEPRECLVGAVILASGFAVHALWRRWVPRQTA